MARTQAASDSGNASSKSSRRAARRAVFSRISLGSSIGSGWPRALTARAMGAWSTCEGRASPGKPVRLIDQTSMCGEVSKSRQNRPVGTSPMRRTFPGGDWRRSRSPSGNCRPPRASRSPLVASANTGAPRSWRKFQTVSCSSGSRPPRRTTVPFSCSSRSHRASAATSSRFLTTGAIVSALVQVIGWMENFSSSEILQCQGASHDQSMTQPVGA